MRPEPEASTPSICCPLRLPIWACPHGQAWPSSQCASCCLPGVWLGWEGGIWLPAGFAPCSCPEGWLQRPVGTAARPVPILIPSILPATSVSPLLLFFPFSVFDSVSALLPLRFTPPPPCSFLFLCLPPAVRTPARSPEVSVLPLFPCICVSVSFCLCLKLFLSLVS